MSAPNPKLYERGTDTPLAEFDFDELTGPAESAELEFDLANEGAAAETMTEVSFGCEESLDGGVTWTQGTDNSSICFRRMLHVLAEGQDGDGITPQTTSYTPTGVGARLYLDPIPAECRRLLKAKLVVPAGHSTASRKIKLIPYWREAVAPLPQGLFETGRRGVLSGIGDATRTYLLQGGTLAQTGTADGNVQITDTVAWVAAGVPHVRYAGAVAIAASGAGLARWVTLSLGSSGTPTQTASAPVTAPAPVGDRPAVPAGEAFLGYVHRDDGTIVTADIFTDEVLRAPFHLAVDGLDWIVGPGWSLVDNRLVRRDYAQTGTFADDETTVLYQNPADGSISQVLSGNDPADPRAEPLWQAVTVSGVVTVRDLRNFLGPRAHRFAAHFSGTNSIGQAVYYTQPHNRRGYVALPAGAQISAGTIGDRGAGVLRIPLEYWDGAAWTSMFSTTAQEPQLAFNATDLVVSGFLPDRLVVEPGARLRWRIAAIPTTGGTVDPTDAQATVDIVDYPV